MRAATVYWMIVLVGVAADLTAERRRAAPHPHPPPPHLYASSYENYKEIGLVPQVLPSGDNSIRAYADFTGHSRFDLFRAVLTYITALPMSQATPSRFEFFANNPDGSFTATRNLLADTNGCIHPRKAIVADFNNDGRPDVFVACHGFDAPPFPGERSKVVLSQPDGSYVISDASSDVGFNHGATAADLNGDGFADVIVVSNPPYVLLNDGHGHFKRELVSRLPEAIRAGGYYSVELIDVNQDGRLDLLLGGHEFDGAATLAVLNPGSNNFSSATVVLLPAVMNDGVVLDFTVTGTAESRTLWMLRTSGGDGTFYQSRVLQKVAYPSLVSSVVINERPGSWIPWVIPAVVRGAKVITSDNIADVLSVSQ